MNCIFRNAKLSCLLLISLFPAYAAQNFLFVYFKEPAKSGIYYALSTDGYHWNPLNGGNPVLPPEKPGELMRDIFVTRGPDRRFHAVWTWGWRAQSIGYADSPDLVHWSPQRQIPLMADIPQTIHTWAPEIYWDKDKREWLIIWSSITGGETRNRIYYSFTRNFADFTKPAVFFDPGYDVIDATILHDRGRYYLIFKDQTKTPLRYQLRIASGPSLEGPWTGISNTFTPPWSEGPSALRIKDNVFIYYDHYRPPRRYQAVRSSDLRHWTPIDKLISFPKDCKHGSFLKITKAEAKRIQSTSMPAPTLPAGASQ